MSEFPSSEDVNSVSYSLAYDINNDQDIDSQTCDTNSDSSIPSSDSASSDISNNNNVHSIGNDSISPTQCDNNDLPQDQEEDFNSFQCKNLLVSPQQKDYPLVLQELHDVHSLTFKILYVSLFFRTSSMRFCYIPIFIFMVNFRY
jgi:hypothetical protein